MCEAISGPKVKLKPTLAWKAVTKAGWGPYYAPRGSNWNTGKTIHAFPESNGSMGLFTGGGIHCFKSRKSAREYAKSRPGWLKVIRIKIWGEAIPFKSMYGAGWAVEHARRVG